MNSIVRQSDIVSRFGGDEFVVALVGLSNKEELDHLLRRFQNKILLPVPISDLILNISASFGVSVNPNSAKLSAVELIHQADEAMYEAKKSGKNKIYFFWEKR